MSLLFSFPFWGLSTTCIHNHKEKKFHARNPPSHYQTQQTKLSYYTEHIICRLLLDFCRSTRSIPAAAAMDRRACCSTGTCCTSLPRPCLSQLLCAHVRQEGSGMASFRMRKRTQYNNYQPWSRTTITHPLRLICFSPQLWETKFLSTPTTVPWKARNACSNKY